MKIRFTEDKFYNGELKYKKDVVHEIPTELGQAERWLKRGGVEVIEEVVPELKPEAQKEEEIVAEVKPEIKLEVKPESKKHNSSKKSHSKGL